MNIVSFSPFGYEGALVVVEVEKELCYDNYMTPSEAKKFGIIDKIDVVLA